MLLTRWIVLYITFSSLAAPLLDLRRIDLAQLVDRSCVASHSTLGNLERVSKECLVCDGVCGSIDLDADDANPGVVLGTIMLTIAEVTHPSLQAWAVVLLDSATVGIDGGRARDGRPLAGAIQEADVDLRILLQLIRLVRFGVGKEEQLGAILLLRSVSNYQQ